MKTLVACFGLCCVLAHAVPATAQAPRAAGFETTLRDYDRDLPQRRTMADELIFERAQFRAYQRVTRMETRKWLGQSALRPDVTHGAHAIGMNPGMDPWWGWYSSPVWLNAAGR